MIHLGKTAICWFKGKRNPKEQPLAKQQQSSVWQCRAAASWHFAPSNIQQELCCPPEPSERDRLCFTPLVPKVANLVVASPGSLRRGYVSGVGSLPSNFPLTNLDRRKKHKLICDQPLNNRSIESSDADPYLRKYCQASDQIYRRTVVCFRKQSVWGATLKRESAGAS